MSQLTRRKFVKIMGMAGAAAIIPWRFDLKNGWQAGAAYAAINSPGRPLWGTTLRGVGGPSGIPVMSSVPDPHFANTDFYNISIGEFTDDIGGGGQTKLWGYFDTTNPVKKHLGGLILAHREKAVRIRFTNTLPPQHIIPVDITVLGANQAVNRTAVHLHGGLVPWTSDGGPFDWWMPAGIQYAQGSSFLNGPGGFLDNLYAAGLKMAQGQADYYYPNNQSARLVWYHDHAWGTTRINAYAGIATGYIITDTPEADLVTSGKLPTVGGAQDLPIIIQDKIFIGPNFTRTAVGAVAGAQIDPTWPLTCPDTEGSLWYAHTYDPKIFKLKGNKKGAGSIPDPSAIPEFFGDTMLANGTVYPEVVVGPGRYRLRFLNACNARFLNLQMYVDNGTADGITLDPLTMNPVQPATPEGPSFLLFGTEGGFLPTPVNISSNIPFNPLTIPYTGSLMLGCAERADVIVDFTGYAGAKVILYNDAAAPFPVGAPIFDYFPGLANGNPVNLLTTPGFGPNTRVIMRFKVTASAPPETVTLAAGDVMPGIDLLPFTPRIDAGTGAVNLPPGVPVKQKTLNEAFDAYGRLLQLIGTNLPLKNAGGGFGRGYVDAATEVIANGATEVWEIANLSADTHPIHFHLVNVQVLGRRPFKVTNYNGIPAYIGPGRLPDPDEMGWKETVRMHPGEVITVLAKFDLPWVNTTPGKPFDIPTSPRAAGAVAGLTDPGDLGLQLTPAQQALKVHEYVWHCHILEHEEHDMMRPLVVLE